MREQNSLDPRAYGHAQWRQHFTRLQALLKGIDQKMGHVEAQMTLEEKYLVEIVFGVKESGIPFAIPEPPLQIIYDYLPPYDM